MLLLPGGVFFFGRSSDGKARGGRKGSRDAQTKATYQSELHRMSPGGPCWDHWRGGGEK